MSYPKYQKKMNLKCIPVNYKMISIYSNKVKILIK